MSVPNDLPPAAQAPPEQDAEPPTFRYPHVEEQWLGSNDEVPWGFYVEEALREASRLWGVSCIERAAVPYHVHGVE